jgi:hypothetical protein
MPQLDHVSGLNKRFGQLEQDLTKIEVGRGRLIDAVEAGSFTPQQIAAKVATLRSKEERIKNEMNQLAESVGCTPSKEDIQAVAKAAAEAFKKRRYSAAKRWQIRMKVEDDFAGMTWNDKRSLIESVFNPEFDAAVDGRRPGIYVSPIDGQIHHRRKKWGITLRGMAIGDRQCVTQMLSC